MSSRWEDTCDSCGEWMMGCLCPHNNKPIKSADEEMEEIREFDYTICKLEDSWLDFHVNKYQESKVWYEKALHKYREANCVTPDPILVKTKLIDEGSPQELARIYTLVDKYIQENEVKGGWEFSHISHKQVDCNTGPYEDYPEMKTEIQVYAVVYAKEKLASTEAIQSLYNSVLQAERGLLMNKKYLMEYLKGEYNR
tara:strand:+ start:19031 stop:19621 length:591 start_codon:yes stop_codon:yes gene_type:complete